MRLRQMQAVASALSRLGTSVVGVATISLLRCTNPSEGGRGRKMMRRQGTETMKTTITATAIAAALVFSAPASAATTISGIASSFSVNNGSGLLIFTQMPNPFSVTLDEGTSSGPIQLFTIGTGEGSVDLDDLFPRSIAANFTFDSPNGAMGSGVSGTTTGFYTLSLGGACGVFAGGCGRVQWDGPQTFAFGNGGSFRLNLSNAQFTTPGSAAVFGTFDLISSGVPEASTWAMMIAGIGLMGGALRRRKVTVAYA